MILKTNLSKSKTELYKRLLKFIFGTYKRNLFKILHIMTNDPINIRHDHPCCILISGSIQMSAHKILVTKLRTFLIRRGIFIKVNHINILENISHSAYYLIISFICIFLSRTCYYKYFCIRLYTLQTLYDTCIATCISLSIFCIIVLINVCFYISYRMLPICIIHP